jgi:type IV secretory pathway VirJ component
MRSFWVMAGVVAALLVEPGGCVSARAEPQAGAARPAGVEDTAVRRAHTFVLVLSGDGGWWGDIDRRLAERLGEAGYAVAGFDTHDWFQKRRSLQEIALHLDGIITTYQRRTGAKRIALVGYSYGADILPVAMNRFTAETRAKVSAVVLAATARGFDPHVTLLEQAGLVKPTVDLAPEFAVLDKGKLVCIYGADQGDDSGCTLPEMAGAEIVELPGGHHFDGKVETFAQPVLAALERLAPLN